MNKIISGLKFTLLLFALCICNVLIAQTNTFKFIEVSDSLYKAKDYKQAIKLFEKGLLDGNREYGYRMNDYYFISCCYAKLSDKNNAFKYLFTLTEDFNYSDSSILKDKDLDNVKDDSRWLMFKDLIEINYTTNVMNKKMHANLISTLESYYDKDQEEVKLLDAEHLKRFNQHEKDSINKYVYNSAKKRSEEIQDLIKIYTWLSRDILGQKAFDAIFLSVQHSNDTSLMNKYLSLLMKHRKSPMDYYYSALLFDRIKMFNKEKQRYGTQVIINISTGKKYYYLIENKELINNYRKYCYLDSMEEDMKWQNMIKLEESTREEQEKIR
jgi:hypothetical protein